MKAIKSYSEQDTLFSVATGYGKSLTYELLPFYVTRSLVLVIVPVDAIKFQEMEKLGNLSLFLGSDEVKQIKRKEGCYHRLLDGTIMFMFTHPETLCNKSLKQFFSTLEQQMFIVADEAHCLEMWGEDFRPAFRSIGDLLAIFKRAIMIAMTATVSPSMVANLRAWMKFRVGWKHIAACPIRENIYLEVNRRPPSTGKGRTAESSYESAFDSVMNELMETQKKAVVYCTLHWCQFALEFVKRQQGEKFGTPEDPIASLYHASLTSEVLNLINI